MSADADDRVSDDLAILLVVLVSQLLKILVLTVICVEHFVDQWYEQLRQLLRDGSEYIIEHCAVCRVSLQRRIDRRGSLFIGSFHSVSSFLKLYHNRAVLQQKQAARISEFQSGISISKISISKISKTSILYLISKLGYCAHEYRAPYDLSD